MLKPRKLVTIDSNLERWIPRARVYQIATSSSLFHLARRSPLWRSKSGPESPLQETVISGTKYPEHTSNGEEHFQDPGQELSAHFINPTLGLALKGLRVHSPVPFPAKKNAINKPENDFTA